MQGWHPTLTPLAGRLGVLKNSLYKKEQELYKLLDGVVDMEIRCATEEHHKTWFDYRQKIRLYMLEHGWCFNCGSFSCECNDDR